MDIIEATQENMSGAMDYFVAPGISISEDESYMMKVYPTSSIDNRAPIIYELDIDDSHYADLSECYHYVRLRVTKSDHTNIADPNGAATDGTKVAPINYYGSTMFQNVELYLNGELIESSNNLYPYKSYLQSFLSYGNDVKSNQLALAGYYQDTSNIDTDGIRDTMAAVDCSNKGLHQRYERSKHSRPVASMSRLHLDMCTQGRYIQNRTNVKIRLSRVEPRFGLIAKDATQNFNYEIEQAYLLVRMVKPRESLRLAVEESLEQAVAKYPTKSCEMRFFTFAGNSNTLSEPNLYSGKLPTRVALGLVDADAMDGVYTKSPFNFKPFTVTEVDLKVNGKSVTTDPLKIDLEHDDYALPYFWLYKSTGGLLDNEALVDYEQFKKGYFLYVFDLTEDGEHGGDHFHQPKSGVLSLDIRIRTPPNSPVALIALFEREIMITCDRERNYKVVG
jgi:hypothetical protein